MTRNLTFILMAAFASLAFLTGYDGVIDQLEPLPPTASTAHNFIAWLRIIGGIVGMMLGVLGIWVYYRTTIRTKVTEGLEKTVGIQTQQITALESLARQREEDLRRREEDFKTMMLASQEREKEVITLRARTDLTEVLKAMQIMAQAQNESMVEASKHDQTVMDALKVFMETSDTRYVEGMGLLKGLLEHLNTQGRETYEIASSLAKSISNLSRRFGEVENKVDAVADTVGAQPAPAPARPAERRRSGR